MRTVTSCFGCGGTTAEPVFEFNGLVLLDEMRQSPLARYAYVLCDRCGLVYASRRPEGDELTFLYSRFDEFLGRTEETGESQRRPAGEAGARWAERLSRGWLVSEETGLADDAWLADVLAFRVAESYHADIITALVPLAGARVLELRAFDGHMLHQFRAHHGASAVLAMPISERADAVIRAMYDDVATARIDFDEMAIPSPPYDLVIARHVVTHALHADRFWQGLGGAVSPGGWLYLYLENDDATMFAKRKNLLGEMKCFHFQNFDLPCLARVLRANGFDPVYLRHPKPGKSEMVCLARHTGTRAFTPIATDALADRHAMYTAWRAVSALTAPKPVRALFGRDLSQIEAQALEAGQATRDESGRVIPARFRLMHEEGYALINERGQMLDDDAGAAPRGMP